VTRFARSAPPFPLTRAAKDGCPFLEEFLLKDFVGTFIRVRAQHMQMFFFPHPAARPSLNIGLFVKSCSAYHLTAQFSIEKALQRRT
jgi:hypothetical protein